MFSRNGVDETGRNQSVFLKYVLSHLSWKMHHSVFINPFHSFNLLCWLHCSLCDTELFFDLGAQYFDSTTMFHLKFIAFINSGNQPIYSFGLFNSDYLNNVFLGGSFLCLFSVWLFLFDFFLFDFLALK